MTSRIQMLWRSVISSALALTLLPAAVFAQTPITSTAQLKAACESSANNTVLINYNANINTGAPTGTPEQITTSCTINLTNNSEISFDKVGINFAGPFQVIGNSKNGFKAQDSVVSAAAFTYTATWPESYFQTNNAKVQATAGNLVIDLGSTSKIEMKGQQAGATLVASAQMTLTATTKAFAGLTEVNFQAGNGLTIYMNGGETTLKIEKSTLQSAAGNMNIIGRYFKSIGEIFGSTLTTAGELNLDYAQVQAALLLTENTLQSGGRTILAGGSVTGLNKVSGGSITAGGPVLIWNGSGVSGEVAVDKVTVSAVGELSINTSSSSKTAVKDSTLTSTTEIRIYTGALGICETANLVTTAPVKRICGVTS